MSKRLSNTEKELAEECKIICDRFNFRTGDAYSNEDRKLAAALYKKIFYDRSFIKIVYKRIGLYFDNDSYSKIHSCSRCGKKIFRYLKEFHFNILKK